MYAVVRYLEIFMAVYEKEKKEETKKIIRNYEIRQSYYWLREAYKNWQSLDLPYDDLVAKTLEKVRKFLRTTKIKQLQDSPSPA
jgi:uncharacterized protein (UPF0128 family)